MKKTKPTGKWARKQRAFNKKVKLTLVTQVVDDAVKQLVKTRKAISDLLAERYTWHATRPRQGHPTSIEKKIREAKLLRAALARALKVAV